MFLVKVLEHERLALCLVQTLHVQMKLRENRVLQ